MAEEKHISSQNHPTPPPTGFVRMSLRGPTYTQPSHSEASSKQVFLKRYSKSEYLRTLWFTLLGAMLLGVCFKILIRFLDQKVLGTLLYDWFKSGPFTYIASSSVLSTVLILGSVFLSIILLFYLTKQYRANEIFQEDPMALFAASCTDEEGASLLEEDKNEQAIQKRMEEITERFNQGRARKYTIQYTRGTFTLSWNNPEEMPALQEEKKSLWQRYITEGGWHKEEWRRVEYFYSFLKTGALGMGVVWGIASLITGKAGRIIGDPASLFDYSVSFSLLGIFAFLIPLIIYGYKISNWYKNRGIANAMASKEVQEEITALAQFAYFSEQQRKAVEKIPPQKQHTARPLSTPSHASSRAQAEEKGEEKNVPDNAVAPYLAAPPLKLPSYSAIFRYGVTFFIMVMSIIRSSAKFIMSVSAHITRSNKNSFIQFLSTTPLLSLSAVIFSLLATLYNLIAWYKKRKEEVQEDAKLASNPATPSSLTQSVETLASEVFTLQTEIALSKAKYKAIRLEKGASIQDLEADPLYNTQILDASDLSNIVKPWTPGAKKMTLGLYTSSFLFAAIVLQKQIASSISITRDALWMGSTSILEPAFAWIRGKLSTSIPKEFIQLSGFSMAISLVSIVVGALLYSYMILRQKKAEKVYEKIKQRRTLAPLHAQSLQTQLDVLSAQKAAFQDAFSEKVIEDAEKEIAIEDAHLLSAISEPDFSNRTLEKKQRLQYLYAFSIFVLYGLFVLTATPFFSSDIFSITPYVQTVVMWIVPLTAVFIAHHLFYAKHMLTPAEKSNLQLLFAGVIASFLGCMLLYTLPFSGVLSFSSLFLLPITATGIFSLRFFKRDIEHPIAEAQSAIAHYEANRLASEAPMLLELALDATIMAMYPRDGKQNIDIANWNANASPEEGSNPFLVAVLHLKYVRARLTKQEAILQKDLKKVEAIFERIKKTPIKKEIPKAEAILPVFSLPECDAVRSALVACKGVSADEAKQEALRTALNTLLKMMQTHQRKEMDVAWTNKGKAQFQDDIQYLSKLNDLALKDKQRQKIKRIAARVETAIQASQKSPATFLIPVEEKKRIDIYSLLFLLFFALTGSTALAVVGLRFDWSIFIQAPLQGMLLLFAAIKLAANTQVTHKEKLMPENAAAAMKVVKKLPPSWQKRFAVSLFFCVVGAVFLTGITLPILQAVLKHTYISPRWIASFITLPLVATPFLYRLLDHFFPGKFPRLAKIWEGVKTRSEKITLHGITKHILFGFSFVSTAGGIASAIYLSITNTLPAFLSPWTVLVPFILGILTVSLLLAKLSMHYACEIQEKTGSAAIPEWQKTLNVLFTYIFLAFALTFSILVILLLTLSSFVALPLFTSIAPSVRVALDIALISGLTLSFVFFVKNKRITTPAEMPAPASAGMLIHTEDTPLKNFFGLTDMLFLPTLKSGYNLYTGKTNTFEKVATPLEAFALIMSVALYFAKKSGNSIPNNSFFLGGFFAITAFRAMHDLYHATENCDMQVQLKKRLEEYNNLMEVKELDTSKKEVLLKEIAAFYFVDIKENPDHLEREKLFAPYAKKYSKIGEIYRQIKNLTPEEQKEKKDFVTHVLQVENEKQTKALLHFLSAVTAAAGCILWGTGHTFFSAGMLGDITRIICALGGLLKFSEGIYASGIFKQHKTVEKKREAFLKTLLEQMELETRVELTKKRGANDKNTLKDALRQTITEFMWETHHRCALPPHAFSEKELDASVDAFMLACIHTPDMQAQLLQFLSPLPVAGTVKEAAEAQVHPSRKIPDFSSAGLFFGTSSKVRESAITEKYHLAI